MKLKLEVTILSRLLQLKGGDPEHNSEKMMVMNFREVEELAFSFRNLVMIDNLQGFERLTKLQLDNNRISTIDNLTHLVC